MRPPLCIGLGINTCSISRSLNLVFLQVTSETLPRPSRLTGRRQLATSPRLAKAEDRFVLSCAPSEQSRPYSGPAEQRRSDFRDGREAGAPGPSGPGRLCLLGGPASRRLRRREGRVNDEKCGRDNLFSFNCSRVFARVVAQSLALLAK
jgi:hypothetical protein